MQQRLFYSFLLSLFITSLAYGQDWNAVNLMVTSEEGVNACHRTGKFYDFNFSISVPATTTTNIAGHVITETYTIITDPSGLETIVSDAYGRASIYEGLTWVDRQRFGSNASGSVEVAYDDAWNAPNISLRLTALVRFTRTEKIGNDPVVTTQDEIKDFLEIFNFTLKPNVSTPPHILVDGTASTSMTVDAISGCKVYTLTAPTVRGADRYEWKLSDPAWLVSPSSSLTSNSIQIQPTWTNSANGNAGSITLEAIQDCGGERKNSFTIPVTVSRPSIVADQAALCSNQGVATLSIPPASGTPISFTWVVDATMVEIVSGQGTTSAQFRAKGDFATNTTINLVMTTPCGSFNTHKTLWIGKPTILNPNCTDNPNNIDPPSPECITQMCRNSYYTYENRIIGEATGMNAVTNWQWRRLSNNYAWTTYGNIANIQPYQYGLIAFEVRAENACGWSDWAPHQITVPRVCTDNGEDGDGDDFESLSTVVPEATLTKVYPNPASKTLYVELANPQQLEGETKATAELFDLLYSSKTSVRIEDAQAQLDISDLPKGAYILRITIGEQVENHQVIIQ